MTGGRTDASTSTDDVKGRPLCLFYFTHPFGVLSPEPPVVTRVGAASPHLARAFLDMQPVSCFRPPTSPSDDYDTTSSSHLSQPIRLLRPADDSLSSSLFSGDGWLRGGERRVLPYSRTLPPLQLPTPRELAWDGSDDVWPARCFTREKFSLPPIELPCSNAVSGMDLERMVSDCCSGSESPARGPCRRRAPPTRHRRARLSGVQRMVTCLMRRTVKDPLEDRRACFERNKAMGYLLDNCPTVNWCCWCVPLRAAVVAVAVAGFAWGLLYCFLFSCWGARLVEAAGAGTTLGAGLRYVHGALGVQLLAVNALLLAAAAHESDSLCEVYLWFTVVFCASELMTALVVLGVAAAAGRLAFAAGYSSLMVAALLLAGYFSVVVGNYRMTLP